MATKKKQSRGIAKRKVEIRTFQIPDHLIYRTVERRWVTSGFLVTTAGELDWLVAYVPCLMLGVTRALAMARRIAEDPESIKKPAIDLRPYGRLTSPEPMPGFVYGLQCIHMIDPRDMNGTVESPDPFCRFRCARMIQDLAELISRPPQEQNYRPVRGRKGVSSHA